MFHVKQEEKKMKTLNKKHLKTINDLIFTIRTNNDCRNNIDNKDVQTDEEKTFSTYLFWDTRLVSMELYENYGIALLNKCTLENVIAEKEAIISRHDRAYIRWQEAKQKVA